MRRTEQEFKAEVFRRSETFKARRKRRIRNILVSFSCFALLVCAQQVLSNGFGGSSAECADEAVEYFLQNQDPAAAEREESLQEEPMEIIQDIFIADKTMGNGSSPFVQEIILQPDDYEIMDAIANGLNWMEEISNCLMDVTIIRGSQKYRFSTECGVLYDVQLGMTALLQDDALDQLTELMEMYQ